MLNRWTSIPGYKDEMWFSMLRTLFEIKKKYHKNQSDCAVNKIIFDKISEFLQMMSKNIMFENIIKVLLEIDVEATFRYSKEWFKNLFVSKSDQEFVYRSAKKLLSNENSSMIDNIHQRQETGFKGGQHQICNLCRERLIKNSYERALVFCMCDHNFHQK
mmetsp:Transcript_12591/g.11127  ORF Transcript_12591/g.11127 Transcript_12591/m.11127 type:complete len:160 (+) Transcript_12591:886-1365(+)